MARVFYDSFDTTLRDAAQALDEEHQFEIGSKPVIANEIAQLGITTIEAGFPATKEDYQEVVNVANSIGNTDYTVRNWLSGEEMGLSTRPPMIAGLSRTVPSDIETTWSAIEGAARPRIHTFISTDADHMKAKFPGKSPSDVLDMGRYAIRQSKSLSQYHPGATTEFSAEASTTTDEAYLKSVAIMSAEEGVDVLNMPDTVSQRDPRWMYTFYRKVMEWTLSINPELIISGHCHNQYGLAVANSLALFEAATDYAAENNCDVHIQIEGTICGLGECCGNADEIAVAAGGLFKFVNGYAAPVQGSFNPERSLLTAKAVMNAAKYDIPPKSPIVGSESHIHRSGIHSDGIIKGGFAIYTPHDPRFWGHTDAAVHGTGRYQGKSGRQAAQSKS